MTLSPAIMEEDGPGAAPTAPVPAGPDWRPNMAKRTCSIEGCDKAHYARGWCHHHYYRWLHAGDPLLPNQQQATAHAAGWAWCDEHESALYDGASPCIGQHPKPEECEPEEGWYYHDISTEYERQSTLSRLLHRRP